MRSFNSVATVVLATLVLCGLSCGSGSKETNKPALQGVPLEAVGLSESALDRKVDPCVDFYKYACGGWFAKTKIPNDQARWGRGFSEIRQRNYKELKRLLEESSKAGHKAGKFYAACMDEATIEKSDQHAVPYIVLPGRLSNKQGLADILAALHKFGIDALFKYDVDQDFKDPNLVIAYLFQGGLGLPDRDYYLKKGKRQQGIRAAYLAHVQRMYKLLSLTDEGAKIAAAAVMKVETAIAKLHKTRVQMRNVKGLYNPVGKDGLVKMSKAFDWNLYFKSLGHPQMKDIAITTPALFKGFDKLIDDHSLKEWKSYLLWRVLDSIASARSKKFVAEKFSLSRSLTGQKQLKPRWKRCIAATTAAMPDEVSKMYIKTMFPGDSKKAAEGLIHAISNAFAENVTGYDWMDSKTKAKALEKRKMMAYLIGYPSKWKQYEFKVRATSHLTNVMEGRKAKQLYELNKVGKPGDRNEWLMSASTVNAYYHPLKNHMVFPAGILQSPFYNVKAGVAVNLGGMGMIVGHELTHGFDDQGSQFSATGKLENWWSPDAAKKFNAKKQCVIDQYNRYEILPGLKVNGKLTLGENIADMGGIKLAFQAYRKLRKGAKPVRAGGFTEDQQFFLSVGQAWCTKATDKITRMLINVDSHSPPRFRVNGALTSVPEFAKAFSCKPGTPMTPPNRCSVW